MPMDGAGHHLLAGSGLAQQEHRRIAIGEQSNGLLHIAHSRA
jgi:hypothetical protein